ncbi:MAG: hypothetical protein ACXIT9_03370 [Nitritalea sp.]
MRELRLAVLVVLICSFASCSQHSEKDNYLLYLEEILGEAADESQRYVVVSDYSCSTCKEQVYREIEEKSTTKVCIILQPRNKVILQDRFQEAIRENRLIIDTARLNQERGVIIDKAVEIQFQEGKWELKELDGNY